jgi:hypothetical protein
MKLPTFLSGILFLFGSFMGRNKLPQKNVFEVLPAAADIESITFGDLHGPEPWFHALPSYTADLVNLCLICRILKPRTVFEIGTLTGYTTLHLALNTPPESRIYTLDLPKDRTVVPKLSTSQMDRWFQSLNPDPCFHNSPVADKITCLRGDSAVFDFSPFHGKVDFFFIDGAHSFEHVRSDTLNALRCTRPGGVIAWHDYYRLWINGVSWWLHKLSGQYPIYAIPGGSLAFMVQQPKR